MPPSAERRHTVRVDRGRVQDPGAAVRRSRRLLFLYPPSMVALDMETADRARAGAERRERLAAPGRPVRVALHRLREAQAGPAGAHRADLTLARCFATRYASPRAASALSARVTGLPFEGQATS